MITRALRPRRHQRLDVLDVRVPVEVLGAPVVHRAPAAEVHRAGPQRVVGRRDEDLVAGVEQRLQRHHDQLGHAVAEVHVIRRHAGNAKPGPEVPGDGLAGRRDPPRVAVPLRVRDGGRHPGQHRVRGEQPEGRRVPDVQLDDLVPLRLKLASSPEHGSANVVTDVGQPARLRHHGGPPQFVIGVHDSGSARQADPLPRMLPAVPRYPWSFTGPEMARSGVRPPPAAR